MNTYQATNPLNAAHSRPGQSPPNHAHSTTVGKSRMNGTPSPRTGARAKRSSVATATAATAKAYPVTTDGLRVNTNGPRTQVRHRSPATTYNDSFRNAVAIAVRFARYMDRSRYVSLVGRNSATGSMCLMQSRAASVSRLHFA